MKVIGITGSSGSGKSTLSSVLASLELPSKIQIIDADQVAKELAMPGKEYLIAIKNEFGDTILQEDGSLDRVMLARTIYGSDDARNRLNNLTFKYVVDEIKRRVESESNNGTDFVFIDAPLLFEAGLDLICDKIVVLISSEDLKVKRICARDGITEPMAKIRLQIQKTDEYFVSRADYVIKNDEVCDLKKEAMYIIENL